MRDLQGFLKVEPVGKFQHPLFNLLDFRFFEASEGGKALIFGNVRLMTPLFAVPYVVAGEVVHFRGERFFVMFGKRIVGLIVIKVRQETVFIANLAVSPSCRRLGVGSFMLRWIARMCIQRKREWLELSVLKGNVPAQRLYSKFRFRKMAKGWDGRLL